MQFVEIKGSVFKKFEKNNLFQMSNSGKWVHAHDESQNVKFKRHCVG